MKNRTVLFILLLFAFADLYSQFRVFDNMYGLKISSSRHFNYIYKDEASPLIKETASVAEALYDTLSLLLGTSPMSKINILITDQSDITNGLATPLVNPTVNIYLTFPDPSFTAKNYDWLAFVLSHELTHIFQATSVNPKILKACNNNVLYLGYSGLPSYMLEGLAVYNESSIQRGRLHDTHFESILRTMIIDDAVQPLDRATAYFNRNWPYSTLSYLYGSYIIDAYINDFKTPASKFTKTDCCACLPYTWLVPDASYFFATGILPNDVLKSVISKASKRSEEIVENNIVNTRVNLDKGGNDNSSPLIIDGNLYYVKSYDYLSSHIVKYTPDGPVSIARVSFTNGLKSADGKIYFDDIEIFRGVDYFYQICRLDPVSKEKSILKGTMRGMYPSVKGNDMFFVRNSPVQQWIVRYNIAAQSPVDSIPVDSSWRIFSTDISQDNRLIATVYRKGGFTDIALLDFDADSFHFMTSDTCTDFKPLWSRSKDGFYFISDREGVNKIYYYSFADTSAEVVYSSNYYVYDYSLNSSEDSVYVQDLSKDGNSIYSSSFLPDSKSSKISLSTYSSRKGISKNTDISSKTFYFPRFSGPGAYGILPFYFSSYDTLTHDTSYLYQAASVFLNADDAQMLSYQLLFYPTIENVKPDNNTFFKYDLELQTVLYCFPRDVEISVYASRESNTRGFAPELFKFFISPEFSISKTSYYAALSPALQITDSGYSFGISAGISGYESGMLSISPSNGYSFSIFPFVHSNASAGAVYSLSLYSRPFFRSVATINLSGTVSTSRDISTRPVAQNLLSVINPLSMVYREIGFDSLDSMSDFSFIRGTISTPVIYFNRGIPIPLLISSAIRFDCLASTLSATYCKSFGSGHTDLIFSEEVSLRSLAYGALNIIPSAYYSYSVFRNSSSYGLKLSIN